MRGGEQNLRFLANKSLYLSNDVRMTLNAKIGGLWIFWRFQTATQVYIIHKVVSWLSLIHI